MSTGSFRNIMNRIIIFLLFTHCSIGIAFGDVSTVFQQTFIREKGAPGYEFVEFFTPAAGDGTLTIVNGGSEDGANGGLFVSSGLVTLNGTGIVGSEQFNQNIDEIEIPVQLQVGVNVLGVELRGKPGGKISVRIDLDSKIIDIPILAEPSKFLTDTPSQVRFQARILPTYTIDPDSVLLYRVDDDLSPLCQPLDNGDLANGDDIAGDSVYSCLATFSEPSATKIGIVLQALADSGIVSSVAIFISAVDPLTEEDAHIISSTQQEAINVWEEALFQFGDTLQARLEAVEIIKTLPGVSDAGVSSDGFTIWINYESGVNGGLMLNPSGTRGGNSGLAPIRVRQSIIQDVPGGNATTTSSFYSVSMEKAEFDDANFVTSAAAAPTPVGNTNVLIWDAYNSDFAPFDEGPQLQQLFQNNLCPRFNVTYIVDGQATVNSVKNFSQFGTIILVTHGAVDGNNQVVFLTRETADFSSIVLHAIDLVLGHISIMTDVFAIRPSFISSLGNFQNSIVYNGSCQSSANATMVNAFIGKGAKTYYGYTRVVNSDFAQNVANQLFNNLVTTLDTTGNSFLPVVPKVDPSPPNATFTQSGDPNVLYSDADCPTGRIAFESYDTVNGHLEIYVVNADGTGQTNLSNTVGKFNRDHHPAWSSDGGRIAFTGWRSISDINDEIYVMFEDGTSQTNLTNHPWADQKPVWSPDGSMIAFESDRDGDIEIYVMVANGLFQEKLTNDLGWDDLINTEKPAWSPNSRSIAFATNFGYGDYDIYVINANGLGQSNLTSHPGGDHHPSWSPDGSSITFTTTRDGDMEIYVMNADGSGQTNLTNNALSRDWLPVWSPDGSKIAFVSDRDGDFDIYVMNADGTGQTNVSVIGVVGSRHPAWSPNSRLIAFTNGSYPNREIYVVNADGTGLANVTNSPGRMDDHPVWSPGEQ